MKGFEATLDTLTDEFHKTKEVYHERANTLNAVKSKRANYEKQISKKISMIKSIDNMDQKYDLIIEKMGYLIMFVQKHKMKISNSFDKAKLQFEANIPGFITKMQKFKIKLERGKSRELC